MSKKSRKPQKPKARTDYIYATTSGAVSQLSVTFDHRTGRISFGQDVKNAYLERSYERSKGPKVVARIPQEHSELSFNEADALDQNYDRLLAVDTNTKVVRGRSISVVGVVTIATEVHETLQGREEGWRFDLPFCLEYGGLNVDKPENFGWLAALTTLADEGHLHPDQRVGLIVDSDLGNLPAYNERSKPIGGGHFLPPGVTLLYASADSGKENMINRALGMADAASSRILAALDAGIVAMPTKPSSSRFFDTYRYIKTNAFEGPITDGIGITPRV
jgi:hypothetical protein